MGFADNWQAAKVDDQEKTEPPEPGTYEVEIKDARAFESKAGNEVLIVDLEVMSGVSTGHRWTELRGFGTEGQVKAAKSMCSRIGVPIDEINSLEDLDAEIKQHIGLYFQVDVVQNGEYRNVYVNQKLGSGPPRSDVSSSTEGFDPQPVPAGDVPEDDIPF